MQEINLKENNIFDLDSDSDYSDEELLEYYTKKSSNPESVPELALIESKEVLKIPMPSGTIIHQRVGKTRDFIKDRTSIIARCQFEDVKLRIRKSIYKDGFDINYIKEKEEYFDAQLEGDLSYLHSHFNENNPGYIQWLWLSDLTILYKCIIKRLRRIVIDIYEEKKYPCELWEYSNLKKKVPLDFYYFRGNFELKQYCNKLRKYGVKEEYIKKYKDLGELLSKTEAVLNTRHNIKFNRQILTYTTILKHGK